MKKLLLTTFFVVTFFTFSAVSASAGVVNNMIKVGLSYADTARFSANLENKVGLGYDFGYYDEDRAFHSVGRTGEKAISMTAAGDIYMSTNGTYSAQPDTGANLHMGVWHAQTDPVSSYEEAVLLAEELDGYPAWINFEYVVRIGSFASPEEAMARIAMIGSGQVVQSSPTGVVVTITKTPEVIFEFDCGGALDLGVLPDGQGADALTWFNGYQYPGGFEYPRMTPGGNLHVYNVVDLEDYVKGVIPFEMNRSWPLAALEAQAICARTFACGRTRHYNAYGFDVCSEVDCQVYYGFSGGSNGPNERTNAAVDNTAGMMLYFNGELVKSAVYHASNGGATENVENVWTSQLGYLRGKEDPYETQTNLPSSYRSWSVTYTADELEQILTLKGYGIGTVRDVYISAYTDVGNVRQVTIVGSKGTVTFSGENARTIFYSSAMGKSVRSMRFTISGGSNPTATQKPNTTTGNAVYVNDSQTKLDQLSGVAVLSGSGTKSTLNGTSFTVLTSSGLTTVKSGNNDNPTVVTPPAASSGGGVYTITGSGSGHNLGLSQYGAKAMAELGYTFDEILHFYYTGITIE